jgi:uncharacterized protein
MLTACKQARNQGLSISGVNGNPGGDEFVSPLPNPMRHKLLHESNGQRTFAVVLDSGDEAVDCLKRFVTEEKILAAQLTAIGAFSELVLLYFDWKKKDYLRIPLREQVEVASLLGDVAEGLSGEPAIHIHVVVGRSDGVAMAGHLGQGRVRPTLEVILTEVPSHLRKSTDPETGLALIRPEA